jgi:hypothetical protein
MKWICRAWLLLFVCLTGAPLWAAGLHEDRGQLLSIEGYQGKPLQFDIREAPVLAVRYADNLDQKRFQALLNGKSISELFHPEPGATEKVDLPIEQGMNQLVFKLNSQDYPLSREAEATVAIKIIKKATNRTYGTVTEWHGKPNAGQPEIDPSRIRFKTPVPQAEQ